MADVRTAPAMEAGLDNNKSSEEAIITSAAPTQEGKSEKENPEETMTTHEGKEQKSAPTASTPPKDDVEDKVPSKRVQEGRAWNNRDRGQGGRGRSDRGRGDRSGFQSRKERYKENIKSDLTSQEESSDPAAIRKQVEFYFSDSNLLSDRFLFERVGGHSNLPVPISTIHSFKRMRHFQPRSAIVEALKESATLNIVDNDTCIQRKNPLPEDLKDKPMPEIQKVAEDSAMARSIYAKGFGREEPGTQFDVEAFFSEFGTTNQVRLRRDTTMSFKGSVFVEWDSEETQKKFLAQDPKPKWKGKELLIKSKKQYCDDKVDDIQAGKIQPNRSDDRYTKDKRGSKHDDDRDWKTRREEDQANGFRDRNDRRGNRKGFGSSGQRGRGDRDRRGGRDRNSERNGSDDRRERRNGHDAKAPTIETTTSPTASSSKPAEPETRDKAIASLTEESKTGTDHAPSTPAPAPPNEESKKRPREDDDNAESESAKAKAQKIEVAAGSEALLSDNADTESAEVKAQKIEVAAGSEVLFSAPPDLQSNKRSREDDDGVEAGDKPSKAPKVADNENL